MLDAVSYRASALRIRNTSPSIGRADHGLGPRHRPRRRHRRRHRRQQPRPPPGPARLDATSSRSTRAPLPNPGGSTGHASNFIFPVDHSREITDLTLDSVRAVQGDGRLHRSPAASRSPAPRSGWRSCAAGCRQRQGVGHRGRAGRARRSSRRRCRSSTTDQFIGAFWTPGVGVVDSLRAGTIMRERALESGALTVVPNVEVTGLDVEDGRDPAGAHHRRRHRGRDRRDRLRRVEPEDRRHGRHHASR